MGPICLSQPICDMGSVFSGGTLLLRELKLKSAVLQYSLFRLFEVYPRVWVVAWLSGQHDDDDDKN